MEYFRSLRKGQIGFLLLILAIVLLFSVLYPITVSRVGFAYMGEIFVPRQESGSTVYEAQLRGVPARFTVAADGSVTYDYQGTRYGPYTAIEDPTAIPANQQSSAITGVELRRGETVVFRGGVAKTADGLRLYDENGPVLEVIIQTPNDPQSTEPSVATILRLMDGPDLTHKGQWGMFLFGVFICLLAALCVLFDDALFRIFLPLWVQGADEDAKPGIWMLLRRNTARAILLLCALVAFILGLR